mmetsp:Transcript_44363/g.58858  ORF Transcript_44363/g.58858 Transcript_44363/m.58858 type:complete len:88 (+) Transcript_44363:170-433(+)
MPDGREVKLNDREVLRILPESIWFDDEAGLGSIRPLQLACRHAILETDNDLKTLMTRNVVLAGGSTLFRGFGDHLRSKILECTPLTT